tara:strand:+ start:1067 stop:5782 length:4716 start_codon:yes stop_codon:yes gene_type:complete
MAKKLVYNYTFDASAQTIKITGLYTLRTLILITNVTDQQIIYNFADSNAGGTVSYNSTNDETTITLEYDTTSMSDGDELQILADDGGDTKIDAGESLVDPVHKFRVSTPQNLIDTDFEYGLQPTKWETIELVSNIPSLYVRDSGITLDDISTIRTLANSETVTVTFTQTHGLNIGDPVEIQGTSSITANGKYVVTSTENTSTFTYKARAVQSTTADIKTAYTTIIPSALFDGSEILFDETGVVTDNAVPSTLTVTTDFRHGIPTGSSVYLRNTVSRKQVVMSNTTPVSSNAPDGDKYLSLDTNSLYIANHAFVNGADVVISPDRDTNANAVLPSTTTGYIPPENKSALACNRAYEGAKVAADTINATHKAASNGNYHKPIFIDTSNVSAVYTWGNRRYVNSAYQALRIGDRWNRYDAYMWIRFFQTSNNTTRAEYRYDGNAPGNAVYGPTAYDIGQHYRRHSAQSTGAPSTLSGYIWTRSTPTKNFAETVDYFLEVRTYEAASDMITGFNPPLDRQYHGFNNADTGGNISFAYAGPRYPRGTYSTLNNIVNHGSGWTYVWSFVRHRPYYDNRYRYYTGGLVVHMTMYNTGWDHELVLGGQWSPLNIQSGRDYSLRIFNGNQNQAITCDLIFLHYTTSAGTINTTYGSIISGQQMANELMTEIAAKTQFANFTSQTGDNNAKVQVISDDRISFVNDQGSPFDFSSAVDSTSYPIIVKDLNSLAGGNDNYYDVSATTNTTIELDTTVQVTPREIECNASDVLYNEDEVWYFITPTGTDHTLTPGQKVTFNVDSGGSAPTGLSDGTEYYAIIKGPKYFTLATSRDNAGQGISAVNGAGSGSFTIQVFSVSGRVRGVGNIAIADDGVITGTNTKFKSTFKVGDQFTAVGVGTTVNTFLTGIVESIVSDTQLAAPEFAGFSTDTTAYFVDTQLNVRTDGTSLHRPFDGGVEMTAGSSPETTIVRQTRKYFRYQSGKGIQCSMAINFNPYRLAQSASGSGTAVTITTEYPHGLTTGDSIKVRGASDSAYNGTFTLTGTTAFTFSYTAGSSVTSTDPDGFIEYVINGYSNAGIRAGLFDFQNGFFFEYDGSDLYAVRRSSVQQLPGTVSVTTKSNVVLGTNTKFSSHLAAGDMVVIRGMSYRIAAVIGDDEIHIQPHYRGSSNQGVVVTKTEDVKVAQSNWNIDKADGSGPSGYILDITTIQMVYMDYSWYGAGKIRFGFKDTYGHVKYMHEFIHNNRLNEAYMRSGNVPARYEAFNSGGAPTFIPSLFHWGTSVIMDGGFDDDDSYLFTASGNSLSFTGGDVQSIYNNADTVLEGRRDWFSRRTSWYAVLSFSSNQAQYFAAGVPLYWDGGQPELDGQPVAFTQLDGSNIKVYVFIQSSRNPPSVYPNPSQNEQIGVGGPVGGGGAIDLNTRIPLISIRLAPSADNNIIGELGERDIVNRMQLKMKELGVSTSHDTEIQVLLNASLSNIQYENVGAPSLSQYVPHKAGDTVDGGTVIYRFRASGGSIDLTGKRLQASNAFDMSELLDLGNSILGGNDVFPNGPDLITIVATVINTEQIDAENPYQVASRLSWAESQA